MKEISIEQVNNGYVITEETNNGIDYYTNRYIFEKSFELIEWLSRIFDWDVDELLTELLKVWRA